MFEARASADYRMAAHTVGSALSRIALAAADSTAVDVDSWSSPGCSGWSFCVFKKKPRAPSPQEYVDPFARRPKHRARRYVALFRSSLRRGVP